MKRPSFQFYPGDWQSNSNLKRCTHEEKGIWIDVMCVLHDQEEYGIARWPLREIAQAVGASLPKLKCLVEKGVLKGSEKGQKCQAFVFIPTLSGRKKGAPITLLEEQEGPIWYSSRMIEDEYKRVVRGEYGNATKTPPDIAPKPPIGAAPKPPPDYAPSRAGSSPSSSSSVNPSDSQPPSQPQPKLREEMPVVAAIPDPPSQEGHWLTWFNHEAGTQLDPASRFDRKDLWPIFRRWCDSGITQQQMREAIREAQETARDPIASLPKYVDRVLANRQSPPRMSPGEKSKLAAARAVFGTEIEGDQHGQSGRVFDASPVVAKLSGG